MAAVALAAILIEGWIVWGRYVATRDRAVMLTGHVKGLRRQVAAAPTPKSLIRGIVVEFHPGEPAVRPTAETLAAWADHLESLANKAARDSRRPWMPIPPDPPFPD